MATSENPYHNIEPEEDKKVSLDALLQEYTELTGVYLKTHGKAFMQDRKRLLLAKEKIERFGGREQVRKNLKGRSINFLILQACRDGAMTGSEIQRFSEILGRHTPIGPEIVWTARGLSNPDEPQHGMVIVVKITGISRISDDLWTIGERVGYETTDVGINQLITPSAKQGIQLPFGRLLKPQQT